MGSFVFKWPHPDASDVHVTGTFDDWGKSEKLNKIGEVWEKEVDLAVTHKKIYYKFVVDDNWIIDPTAPQEDDGHGNVNNVLLPEQIKPKATVVPEAVTTSSAAPQSTTAALAGAVPLEPKKEATEVPATQPSGSSNLPGAFPETPMTEPDSFGVNPLPASSTAGNPINLPAGEKVPPPSEVTPNTVQSTVTQSQEDYEKAGSGLPVVGGALGAAGIGAAGLAAASADKENLIPESSLPIGESAGNTLDAGPVINSAGPTSTTAGLAGSVPLEPPKPATVIEPESTVPEVVKESIAEAHTSPEAAASAEAVKEKSEVEQELLEKVGHSDETGEPAPAIAAEDPTLADEPAVQMMNKNDAEASGVEASNIVAAAPLPVTSEVVQEAPKTETSAAATTSTPHSTPTKKTEATPTSSTASPATGEKKKKNRISAFFKKVFD